MPFKDYSSSQSTPSNNVQPPAQWKALITGGAGFVGSHLVDRLINLGHLVTVVDDLSSGSLENLKQWSAHPNFTFIRGDICDYQFSSEVTFSHILHLACPASPPIYQHDPVRTIRINVVGTMNILDLARRTQALFFLSSTSEVYGDPLKHPQDESYWGNVNPIGPRACYDEGKRVAEALATEYHRCYGVDIRIARIFNTFGPRLSHSDGRVVTNFITQALSGRPLTIYGDGKQTRSFQYIDDLIEGILALIQKPYYAPVNLGNPQEHTIEELAQMISRLCGNSSLPINREPSPVDDPQRRKPDISLARKVLSWSPLITIEEGLLRTIQYLKDNKPV